MPEAGQHQSTPPPPIRAGWGSGCFVLWSAMWTLTTGVGWAESRFALASGSREGASQVGASPHVPPSSPSSHPHSATWGMRLWPGSPLLSSRLPPSGHTASPRPRAHTQAQDKGHSLNAMVGSCWGLCSVLRTLPSSPWSLTFNRIS